MMKNKVQKQNKKLTCPHCGQTFGRAQALGGHIRFKHGSISSSLPAQAEAGKAKNVAAPPTPERVPAPESSPLSIATPAATSEAQPGVVSSDGAHEHLKTALEKLTQRSRQIDEELSRMEALQAEKELIRKQIEAVNSALQAFAN